MKTTKTFAVGIPTLNRIDLLLPTLHFYFRDYPNHKIYILDNGKQGFQTDLKTQGISFPNKNLEIIEEEENLGVAASWNKLCKLIFENNDYALILNDDIYLGCNELKIQELIDKYNHHFYISCFEWCVFLIHKDLYAKVGSFDETFSPAYFEDNDYAYRMKLNGLFPLKKDLLNPMIFRNSRTIDLMPLITDSYKANRLKYIEKWGGLPSKEKFKKPYNQK